MNREDALQRLADIIPPAAPDLRIWWFSAGAFFFAVVAALSARWWMKRRRPAVHVVSSRQAARSQLQTLRAEWDARQVTDRDAAYRLAAILRLGLKLPQLPEAPPPSVQDDSAQWRETVAQLHRQRYAASALQPLNAGVFDRALRWLSAEERN